MEQGWKGKRRKRGGGGLWRQTTYLSSCLFSFPRRGGGGDVCSKCCPSLIADGLQNGAMHDKHGVGGRRKVGRGGLREGGKEGCSKKRTGAIIRKGEIRRNFEGRTKKIYSNYWNRRRFITNIKTWRIFRLVGPPMSVSLHLRETAKPRSKGKRERKRK